MDEHTIDQCLLNNITKDKQIIYYMLDYDYKKLY